MTSDQVTQIGTVVTLLVTTIGGFVVRWTTKSERKLRQNRVLTESLVDYIYTLRRQILGMDKQPTAWPKVLKRYSEEPTEGGEDDE